MPAGREAVPSTERLGSDAFRAPAEAAARPFSERRLVARVYERCGEAIEAAVRFSSLPAEFLVALVANESGGRGDASRFEPAVYRHLQSVARGERHAFGSLTAASLDAEAAELLPPDDTELHARYLTKNFGERQGAGMEACPDEVLRQLATSWGYTQIMGYHMVGRAGTARDLLESALHFRVAVELLSDFAEDYQLNLACEFAELFCCWNTGRPYAKTFDPHYVENGLRRMRLCGELPALAARPAPKRAAAR